MPKSTSVQILLAKMAVFALQSKEDTSAYVTKVFMARTVNTLDTLVIRNLAKMEVIAGHLKLVMFVTVHRGCQESTAKLIL